MNAKNERLELAISVLEDVNSSQQARELAKAVIRELAFPLSIYPPRNAPLQPYNPLVPQMPDGPYKVTS